MRFLRISQQHTKATAKSCPEITGTGQGPRHPLSTPTPTHSHVRTYAHTHTRTPTPTRTHLRTHARTRTRTNTHARTHSHQPFSPAERDHITASRIRVSRIRVSPDPSQPRSESAGSESAGSESAGPIQQAAMTVRATCSATLMSSPSASVSLPYIRSARTAAVTPPLSATSAAQRRSAQVAAPEKQPR